MEPSKKQTGTETNAAFESQGQSHTRAGHMAITGLIFILIFAVFISFFTDFSLFKGNGEEGPVSPGSDQQEKGLVMSQTEVKVHNGGVTTQLTLTQDGKDVTQEAFWYSDDPQVAHVANKEPIKGQVNPRGIGVTNVRAVYNDEFAETTFIVLQPGLAVDCSLIPEEAKIGEEVRLVANYSEGGVPFYEYRWSGDGGLESVEATAYITYDSPGVKKIHYETADTEGSIAEMDCEILVVE